MTEVMWYYADGNRRKGPIARSAIDDLVSIGQIQSATLVWREGMADWEPARDHFELRTRGPEANYDAVSAEHHRRPVGVLQAIGSFFVRYVDLRGRSNRGEFWKAMVVWLAITAGMIYGDLTLFTPADRQFGIGPLLGGWLLLTSIPLLALTVRRLHDTGRRGWWAPGLFLPGAVALGAFVLYRADPLLFGVGTVLLALGAVALIGFLCRAPEAAANRWG